MNSTMKIRIVLSALCVCGLAACSSTKETLGLNKQVPDEFQVVKRAPLSVPPDYVLRPPRPGAARPQEQTTANEAAATIFGQDAVGGGSDVVTSGEAALLSRAGGDNIDPNIRNRVDSETAEMVDRNKPVAKKLLGKLGGADEASASVVDAKAEAERLQDNAQAGKPVTAGETPSIEQ
ncbi:MAG: DUF3035 domain-containing protein [Alphaproteobacteria bacterium]|nr:DUF3035 domain-containing protein [Alphaproteobacteria bacterium]